LTRLAGALVGVLAGSLAASTLDAQSPDDARAGAWKPKSENIATALGIIPGGGHFYAGEAGRGTILVAAFAGGVALVASAEDTEETCVEGPIGEDCSEGFTDGAVDQALAGFALAAVSLTFSLIDAHFAARRTNRRKGFGLGPVSVAPYLASARTGSRGVGVVLRAGW